MRGLSPRRRRVRWGDRRIGPLAQSWRRLAGPWRRAETVPEGGVDGVSSEYSTTLREALRRNGFRGSGDSAADRLTGLLTLC